MQKIYFRADAGSAIGYGHFIRTLALADMLKEDFDCTFFTCHPTPYQMGEMERVCAYVTLQEETHYDEFLSHLCGDEIVVLDNYFFITDYQRAIKQKGCHLVCIDDMHDKHYVADVVINHGLMDESLFDREDYTQLCLGHDWALLREPFLRPLPMCRSDKYAGRVTVCFGGSDSNNLTGRFVRFLCSQEEVKHVIAIIGDKHCLDDEFSHSKVTLLHNQSAEQIVSLFRETDIAFLSASTVCLEALSQQVPVALGYYVDNQKEIYANCVFGNFALPLGNLLNLDMNGLEYGEMVAKSRSLKKISLSMVSSRYKILFHNMFVYWTFCKNGLSFVDYRLLDEEQHSLIWYARNRDCIRLQMEHTESITWNAHLKFLKRLFSQYRKIYMGVYRDGQLIGSVNVDYESISQVERGIFVLPEYWRGGDSMLIEQTLCVMLKERGIDLIKAKVLKSNERSFCFHLKSGYRFDSNDGKYDYLTKELN